MKFYIRFLLSVVLIVLLASVQGNCQKEEHARDSIRTLNIIKETLNEILQEKKDAEQNIMDLEIDGLIVDQTITKMGKDFYDMFFTGWNAPPKAKNYTITIREMILPGMGTQISLWINDTEVFKNRVQPRYDYIEALAQYAVSVVYQYLDNYERMKSQLEGEDQQGSGIF